MTNAMELTVTGRKQMFADVVEFFGSNGTIIQIIGGI